MQSYILVVDDDDNSREALNEIVQSIGFETCMARDGAEAWELIQKDRPSLILLDLLMPRMDGFAVLAHMRAIPFTRCIPVIVVSAGAGNVADELRLPGVLGVIQPGQFTVDSLKDQIYRAIALKNSWRKTTHPHSSS